MKNEKILIPDEHIKDYSLSYEESQKKEAEYREKVSKIMKQLFEENGN